MGDANEGDGNVLSCYFLSTQSDEEEGELYTFIIRQKDDKGVYYSKDCIYKRDLEENDDGGDEYLRALMDVLRNFLDKHGWDYGNNL